MPASTGLKKSLRLADVYAISTGAMFSSGFFLLPGIAAVESGSSVPLAYLLAGVLILPAMFSVAELSTAMPRAGGAYFFLDRSMGPLVGTVGGLGTWLALVLKSAFALLGMGAYLMLFVELPIKPVAVALTVGFAALNILGAKETSGLQRVLVFSLVGILVLWIAQGVHWLVGNDPVGLISSHHEKFLENGIDGLFETVGIVFVSFAGLTKVASVAEEVEDPDRNIPLGMLLSLATATAIYVLGVALMTVVLDADVFHASLTPVAAAGEVIFTWIPAEVGVVLVVVAASAAFASTGNAGLLSSSRYPMAMARDRLLPARFAEVSPRFGTPVLGVVVSAALMIVLILAFDITAVAKLASAFQLLLFGLLNLAVIVMRESRIDYYQPGYRSPLYPWVQIAGMIVPVWLIVEMGWLAVLFTAAVIVVGVAWFFAYGAQRVERGGAVYHVFERLGRYVYRGLDDELRGIVAEKGLHADDPAERLVVDAPVIDIEGPAALSQAVARACEALCEGKTEEARAMQQELLAHPASTFPVIGKAALAHVSPPTATQTRLVLVRGQDGITVPGHGTVPPRVIVALALLVGPESELPLQLRVLAHFGGRVGEVDFVGAWTEARSPSELRAVLLRDDRFLRLRLSAAGPTASLVGHRLREAVLPRGIIVALLQRADGSSFVPGADTELREGDRLTAIGDPDAVETLRQRFAVD